MVIVSNNSTRTNSIMPSLHVFTICASNYLGMAFTLMDSVASQHPHAERTIWLLDAASEREERGVRLRPIQDALDPEDIRRLLLRYDILEYATAVKPVCFQKHFGEGAGAVFYIDPDIYLFRPLQKVLSLLEEHDGVLTPHIMRPLPRDGSRPGDLEILVSGVFNLGFLALSKGAVSERFLAWWWGWLQTNCFADPSTGVFTDQKWMDFAPTLWPSFAILRDPAYNVAYWNLPQRDLQDRQGVWMVDGEPLVFFHFSGFDPVMPELLSKHQDRIIVHSGSALANILKFYGEQVILHDHLEYKKRKISNLCFDNSVKFDRLFRRLFVEAESRGLRFADPLASNTGFYAWCQEPIDEGSPKITRYMLEIHKARGDVRQVYPDVTGQHRGAFISWLLNSGAKEEQIDPRLLEPLGRIGQHRMRCVNYIGYLNAISGLGSAGRSYARAFDAVGVEVNRVDVTPLSQLSRLEHSASALPEPAALADINIFHVNADELPGIQGVLGYGLIAGRYNIGIWAWESPLFPDLWDDRFDLLDEIWVGSSFMADAISRRSPIPVVVIPHPVAVEGPEPAEDADTESDGTVTFLCSFDYASLPERKNPLAVIAAFRKAFSEKDRARLIVKSHNGDMYPDYRFRVQQAAKSARVEIIDAVYDREQFAALMASADVYVSLHRAEGFGLGLAEAMALGKPVVATAWSGNMEFMQVANSCLVGYRLEALEEDVGPYAAGTLWAVPDEADAAQQMRRLYTDSDLRRRIGRRAREDIAEQLSPTRIGERMAERLARIDTFQQGAGDPGEIMQMRASGWGRQWVLRVARVAWHGGLRVLPNRYHPLAKKTARRVIYGKR